MDTILAEVLRIFLAVVFVGGLLWTLVVMYRIYEIDEQPIRLRRKAAKRCARYRQKIHSQRLSLSISLTATIPRRK